MKPGLLVVEPRMLGDVVMSFPFLDAAQAHFDLYVLCDPSTVEAFSLKLPADRIVAVSRRDIAGSIRAARHVPCAVAVSVWADPRVHWVMGFSGAQRRIGFPVNRDNFYARHLGWRKRQILLGRSLDFLGAVLALRPLLTTRLNKRFYLQHHLVHWQQLAEVLQLSWNPSPPWILAQDYPLSHPVGEWCRTLPAASPLCVVHPGARAENRRWPWPNFLRVIRETLLPTVSVCVVQPPDMEDLTELPPEVMVVKPGSLRELVAILHKADFILGNDTGVAHLAAAVGTPIISLFSANIPEWFAPWDQAHLAISSKNCPVKPCFDRCLMPSYICLDGISVPAVQKKVEELMVTLRASRRAF